MAPEVEELIKRVNTLTLDKNRLRQRLHQLTAGNHTGVANGSVFSTPTSLQEQTSRDSHDSTTSSSTSTTIAGVECTTACESDLLYANELIKDRLEDYSYKWELLQSKCSALLSELDALQKTHVRLRRENQQLEEQLKNKCDENEKIKSELQTVVLNYETQLSAMSEHLTSITSQMSLEEPTGRGGPPTSIRNPNYVD